jgi:hypothetical protein
LLLLTIRPESFSHFTIISNIFSKFKLNFEIIVFQRTTKLSSAKLVMWVTLQRSETKIMYSTSPRTEP